MAAMTFQRLLLVDGNNVALRSIHGAKNVEMSVGELHTAPIVQFVNTLSRHIRDEEPDAVMVCWDGGRSRYRSGLSATYKANRPQRAEDQAERDVIFELIEIFLSLAGIQQIRVPGLEGDDLIAKYWAHRDAKETVILSDDHDLRQLVEEDVTVVGVPIVADGIRWTPEAVQEKYGLTPAQLPMLMALTGDSGDGVEGLRGIGPKKGLKMIQAAGYSYPNLLAALTPEQRQIVELSRALTDLRYDIDEAIPDWVVEDCPVLPFDPVCSQRHPVAFEFLTAFLQELKMARILESAERGTLWAPLIGRVS
jgi:DNA polymerase-1